VSFFLWVGGMDGGEGDEDKGLLCTGRKTWQVGAFARGGEACGSCVPYGTDTCFSVCNAKTSACANAQSRGNLAGGT
jgi:hypothetical protein